jgi:hypothetical protein
MGRFIARQPNGRICVFSTVLDDLIAYNLTDRQYVAWCVKDAIREANRQANEDINHFMHDFSDVKNEFSPGNEADLATFKKRLKQMGDKEWKDFTCDINDGKE